MDSSDEPGQKEKIQTYLDFVISKEHAFIRNIFNKEDFEYCAKIKTWENYYESFRLFLQIVIFLNTRYSRESDIEDIFYNCIEQFVQNNAIDGLKDLYLETSNVEIKTICYKNRWVFPETSLKLKLSLQTTF